MISPVTSLSVSPSFSLLQPSASLSSLSPSLPGDRLQLSTVTPTPAPETPTTGQTLAQKLRVAATFAVPTVLGAGVGLGVAAACGASLGIGAAIGAGIGLAAAVGVLLYALKRFQ